ncbi:hypothetical protein AC579_2305 [Pseudocercospora musae]|uniref:Uncharacterized protein n=1 Tax=Pseudocercospora musae TaxID=113226 RepID=A0A139IUW9_9PEZI|nr:hypothetical protein AC579_2305 [Pseudocercospora musae]
MDKTVSKCGRLDASANVAGVMTIEPPFALCHQEGEHGAAGWQWVFDVNVNDISNCLRSELKYWSLEVRLSMRHQLLDYWIDKIFGAAPRGIRINAVAPGAIDTAMLRRAREKGKRGKGQTKLIGGSPIERAAGSEEIAKAVMYLLSHDASFVTRTILSVDGSL